MKRIYVGNLPFQATESEIEALFTEFGPVNSVSLITDRQTGRARGFGFVEMANDAEAEAAIAGVNGRDMGGRKLSVNEAKQRESHPGGVGRGGQSRGGGSDGRDHRDW